MPKKQDGAFECFPHFGGATTAAHPSPAHIEELLKRVMPLPIPTKQINRQDEPLITTVLRRFQIALGCSFLQLQERAESGPPLANLVGHGFSFAL
jgi:hypothetical protein